MDVSDEWRRQFLLVAEIGRVDVVASQRAWCGNAIPRHVSFNFYREENEDNLASTRLISE